jgi:hypothetical protein
VTIYLWICRECGQEVVSSKPPAPIKWTDGHVCSFRVASAAEQKEFGETQDAKFYGGK